LLTGESGLGAGAGELAQRELDHRQQRLGGSARNQRPMATRVAAVTAPARICGPVSAPGSAPVRSAIAAASASLHLGVDLQVLAADRGRAHDQLDRAHQLQVKRCCAS
jgi:hypothetical protein